MPGLVTESPYNTITVRELHPTFGAEVIGAEFANLTDESLAEILSAMAKYGVCTFRETGMDDTAHVEFSRRLGDLDNIKRFVKGDRKLRYAYYELFDAGNIDSDGRIVDPDSATAHASKGNMIFHCDSSFNPRRASFSLLRGVIIPPPGNGGNTEFADSRTAFDELPADLKQELLEKDYTGAHCWATSRRKGSPEYFKDLSADNHPKSYHKIVQRHEPSGRLNLYIGAHLDHIVGVSPEKSTELVRRLNEHASQAKYTVSVPWEQPSDLIIWDNRCTLHRAGAYENKFPRDLRRTTVHDDSSTAWGLNHVGQAMPELGLMKSN